MRTVCCILLWVMFPGWLLAQPVSLKVLFLGNSYTYANNLPSLTAALAASAGDTLFHDQHTPGGYTLGWHPIAHDSDSVSLAKISQQPWDYIVLQEQSQIPAIPALRDSCMIPAGLALRDSAMTHHPCTHILLYLTWGRRFGGMQCFTPNYCSTDFQDFDQMQDSLTRAYKILADSSGGWIAPAGEAWRLVLGNTNMILHDQDNSHPNLKGSYLTACVFYASLFRKPSTGLAFHAGLDPDTALVLQQAADSIVFCYQAYWNLWSGLPMAGFTFSVSGDTLHTLNTSVNSTSWLWDFGDGHTSSGFQPDHVYQSPGLYTVRLTACDSCRCDTEERQVMVLVSGTAEKENRPRMILYGPDHDGRIGCPHCPDGTELSLYDLTGKLIFRGGIYGRSARVGKLSRGVYLWSLTSQGIIFRGKMVKRSDG